MNALPQPQDCCSPCETPLTVSVPGPQGLRGVQWTSGDGLPDDSVGENGDFYINTTTGDVYERISGAYVLQFTTIGVAGRSVTVYDQGGEPGAAIPGDIWISPSDVQIKKADNTWQSIVGATGPAGGEVTTTKGDLVTDDGATSPVASPVRLAVGSNYQTLQADSALPYGVGWKDIDLTGAATSLSGSLPIAKGGTAGTTAATARTNLGLGTSAVIDTGVADTKIPVINDASGITNGEVLFATASGIESQSAATARTSLGIIASNYALYQHQQTLGTDGGTFTSGAWRTVPLTTEVSDVSNLGTLASNEVTLIAGTYRYRAWASAFNVDNVQGRLYNVTATSVIGYGRCAVSSGASTQFLFIEGRFTIASATAVRMEAQCSTTKTTDGFGKALSFGTEVYAGIEFIKE